MEQLIKYNIFNINTYKLRKCDMCSGLGTCINNKCICYKSKTLIYKDINLLRGSSCSELRTFYEPSKSFK